MGIITRFKDIMSANINALLDNCEDPEKMIDQYLRKLENDYASVKAETAAVMAEATSAQRKLNECNDEINKMTDYAKRAVTSGNDSDARQFLEKKKELSEKLAVLQQNQQLASGNAAKMREMHAKLESDINIMKSKRDMLKAKLKVAQTQEKINKLASGVESAGSNMASFDRMEDKVNRMFDQADAMSELNKSAQESTIDDLASKYDQSNDNIQVDDELAALKAEMGM